MNEEAKALQAKLQARLPQKLTLGEQYKDTPLVAIDEVARAPEGAEDLVYRVTAELKGRGYRVANIRRYTAITATKHDKGVALPYMQAGSDATLLLIPGRMILATPVEEEAEATLDDMLAALGDDYDVIIGESFGYYAVPRFLLTDKIQEGYNLGLPNIIGYISRKDISALIPYFSPHDIPAIADKIEEHIIKPCAARKAAKD